MAGTAFAPDRRGNVFFFPKALWGQLMMIDSWLGDFQPATPSSSDAYEAYWSSAEDDLHTSRQILPCSCQPGDAYSELWQLWDAR
jgi:hypothetical protein